MTTDRLLKELEKTNKVISIRYSNNGKIWTVMIEGIPFSFNDHINPNKALQKLYDYAKKEGLLKP